MEEELLVQDPETTPEPEYNFATIGDVYADGVSLIFDGETEPSDKHYLVNTSIVFHAGDRVKIAKDAGTYVVEYVVGNPGSTAPHELPSGGTAGQVLAKSSNLDYAAAWTTLHEVPTGGTTGQVLAKKTNSNQDVQWVDVSVDRITNQYNSGANYVIEFRTTSLYGTPVFQIRMGPSGTWYTLTTS